MGHEFPAGRRADLIEISYILSWSRRIALRVVSGASVMCFSATASFTAGAVLVPMGIVTLSRARSWREAPLAAIPVLFGIQQVAEGALWLRLEAQTADVITIALTHAFLAFAEVIWPMLVPVSAILSEPDIRRRRLIRLFVPYGLAVGLYLLFGMIHSPYQASILGHSILYDSDFPHIVGIEYIYLVGVTVPLLLSSHRMIVLMGIVNAVLLVFAKSAYMATYVSVWCFLAAIASILVFQHFRIASKAPTVSRSGSLA